MSEAGADQDSNVEPHDPAVPEAYARFMSTGWGDIALDLPPHPATALLSGRRDRLAALYPDERLVLPAGTYRTRSNDTSYRFRPDTAHTYLSGNHTSDAVLVIDAGEPTLFLRPRSGRDTHEFFRDREYGELWVGRRPSLREVSDSLGLPCRHIDELEPLLGDGAKTRILRGADRRWDQMLSAESAADPHRDEELAQSVSELRLVKDDWEIAELASACAATVLGFEDAVRDWDRVIEHGERWLEGTFFRRARTMGNDIGYDSIVAGGRHATVLHWIDNTGPIVPGDLVLLDMGIEGPHLYTADITRTLPVSGRFTALQRDLYDVVCAAQQAGIDAVRPGVPFTAPHQAAMSVCAHALEDLGLLPVSADEALAPDSRLYARWTLHGTSHMLGMDVHDCASASPDRYPKGDLAEGMVLTVEPGLYFQAEDLLVPEEMRGIGIRIEDDILVTADGSKNLSAALPRTADEVESWMAHLTGPPVPK
ncbi:MAG: aminopeptidase P family protein [Nocardioides sp.]